MQSIVNNAAFPYVVGIIVGASILIILWLLFNLVNATLRGYEEGYGEAVQKQLEGMFIFIPPQQLLTFKMVTAVMGCMLGTVLTFSAGPFASVMVGLVLAVPFYFIPDKVLSILYNMRLAKFNDQLVDGLITLSNGLRSGLNFTQSLGVMVEESLPPLNQEFNLVLQEIKLGVEIEKALDSLSRRVPDDDLKILVTAINIARGVGGNLAEIFDNIATVIRERKRIEGKIKAVTSQGKLQAIVMASMPVVIAVVLHLMDPATLRYLYTTFPGIIVIIFVAVCDYIGYKIILAIVTIDV
jgi:tight adherence protein B